MKNSVWIVMLFAVSYEQLQCQVPTAPASDATPMVCSFKCTATYQQLLQNCVAPGTRPVIVAPNVNPYDEFDEVIRDIKKDTLNPYDLSYTFASCSTVCNAASIMDPQDMQIIYYNQDFLNKIKINDASVQWAIRCIIAHEIGHQVLGHTLPANGTNISLPEKRKRERRADYFCGFVISYFPGATIDNALAGLETLNDGNYFPKTTQQEDAAEYPTLDNRMEAVRDGFNQARSGDINIALFRSIDSVAQILYNKYGSSQIFRVVDREISVNNFEGAKEIIEANLLKSGNSIYQNKLLQIRSDLQKKAVLTTSPAMLENIIKQSKKSNADPQRIKQLQLELKKNNAAVRE